MSRTARDQGYDDTVAALEDEKIRKSITDGGPDFVLSTLAETRTRIDVEIKEIHALLSR